MQIRPPAVRLARTEIRELLERLVEQSLVSIHITADTVRYFLLESLRLFAEDRLAERSTEQIDEPARLARAPLLLLPRQGPARASRMVWSRRTGAAELGDRGRGRTSGAPSIPAWRPGKPVVGLQIAVGVLSLRAPFLLGSLPEIRGRIEQTLAATQASGPQLTELQLVAMAQIAWLALVEGRPQDAEELLERCVAACDAHAARGGHWRDRPETDIGLPAVVDYAWGVELMWARRDPRAIAVFARAREKFHGIAAPRR